MKKFISAFVMMICIAGIAFAAEESAVAASAAKETAESKTPVAKAATEVTKVAADTVTSVMERRQARREAIKDTLFGSGEKKATTETAK